VIGISVGPDHGITWKNQVASHIRDMTPTALVVRTMPSCHQMIPMNQ
jgi:hypothetical protein